MSPDARIVQVIVDVDATALGALHRVDLGVDGDVTQTARALRVEFDRRSVRIVGFRTPGFADQVARRRWRDEPYADESTATTIDPRTLTIALDDLLPDERSVVTDGGHYLGWPPMYLRLPDARGFVFPQGSRASARDSGRRSAPRWDVRTAWRRPHSAPVGH